MNLATELAAFIAPLTLWDSPEHVARELQKMGLLYGGVDLVPPALQAVIDEATAAVEEIDALVDAESAAAAALSALEIARRVTAIVQTLRDTDVAGLAEPFDEPQWWTDLATALPSYLLLEWLKTRHASAHVVLRDLGIVAAPAQGQPHGLQLAALQSLFAGPADHLRDKLFADPPALIESVHAIAASRGRVRSSTKLKLEGQTVTAAEVPDAAPRRGLRFGMVASELAKVVSIDFDVEPTADDAGLRVTLTVLGDLSAAVELSPTWTIQASAQSELPVALELDAAGLRPGDNTAQADVGLVIRAAPEKPWVMIGEGAGPRLEVESLTLTLGASLPVGAAPVVSAALDVTRLRAVILPVETDSFLSELLVAPLGDGELAAEASLSWAWDSENGFSFAGGADLEVEIPIDRAIGPFAIDHVVLGFHVAEDGLSLSAGVTANAALGPLAFAVDNIGLLATMEQRPDGDGAFGALDFELAFKPPDGFGLSIDAGAITGGGYLFHDPDKGEYAGVAELSMVAVGITAIGLLATKLPDGSQGWSMFLSLSATFTGLQLGFGFTLNGLGGLIGVNRGLDEEALADGIRTGSLEAILFPEDPVAEAPQILAALEAVFPSVQGQYVFGPIAKIGWGTPTLIEVDLGVVIQLPEPLTVSLLGALSSVLPTKEAALVELHVDVAGTVNFTDGTLKIDASLHDSRVLALVLSGDMAVRASFLDEPTFLLAVGGFHPDFTPPADFPSLRRLSVALDTGDDLRLQLGGYFALTSNTVQFGAELSVWAKGLGFVAEGGTSFDALIQFSPFHFVVQIHAWVTISVNGNDVLGVDLGAKLSGPNPWVVAGEASFKLFGVKASLDVNATFGSKRDEGSRAVVAVEELLIAELERSDAWSATQPSGDADGVLLAQLDDDACEVHPAGGVRVAQRIVPLGVRIEHYGDAKLGSSDRFDLGSPRLGTQTVETESVDEWFAAAQYFELSEDEKLDAPSFERMQAGAVLASAATTSGEARELTCDHEVVYRDPAVRAADRERPGLVVAASQLALERAVRFGATLARRTAARMPRSTKPPAAFAIAAPTFVALDAGAGAVASSPGGYFATRELASSEDIVVHAYEPELFG